MSNEAVLIIFVVLILSVAIACWKGGYFESLAEISGDAIRRFHKWLFSSDGIWDSLPEKQSFSLRACYGDFVETKNRRLYTCVEIIPVSTDGFSVGDWNQLGTNLNRIYCAPENTTIQIIHLRDGDTSELSDLLEQQAAQYNSSPVAPIALTQAELIKQQSIDGNLRNSRTFVFIGRKAILRKERIPFFGSLLSSDPYVDLELKEFQELSQDALRAREEFIDSYTRAGGLARRIKARVAFELMYKQLNPARARVHPAPACTEYIPWQLDALGGTLSAENNEISDHYDLFAENPRESLCFSYFEISGSYIFIDGEPHATISLQRLPSKEFSGMMEKLARSAEISFPFQINLHYESGSHYQVQEELESKQNKVRRRIAQSGINPAMSQLWKNEEYTDIQKEINQGEVNLGILGLSINVSAPELSELKARVDQLLSLLRTIEGMEGICNRHNPLPLYLASLPANSHSDFTQRPALSRTAAFLAPITNGPRGLSAKYATEIFNRADGEAFRFAYDYIGFNNRMSLYLGEAGSGKSTSLNLQRLKLGMRGYIGLTFDYGSSAPRVVKALGGKFIDPTNTPGLGLFSIYPQPDEYYGHEELNDIGLPKQRLAAVEFFLEMLCLDRTKETELPRTLRPTLRQAIYKTYDALMDETPIIDDFIDTLHRVATPESAELAERLSDYATNESLGAILNDKATPLSVNQYVVFDFKNAKNNPRLRLIATLAAMNYLQRFLQVDRRVKKFFDVDELNAIVDDPLICKAIDEALRTARKRRCIVSVATQDPADLTQNDYLRGIRSNCKIQWIFNIGNIAIAQRELGLSDGEVDLAKKMRVSGMGSRDCILRYPDNNRIACAHLRIQLDPLTAWLCAGAGDQFISKQQVLKALAAVRHKITIHPNLYAAIEADALGEDIKPTLNRNVESNNNYSNNSMKTNELAC